MPISAAPLLADWREALELLGKALEWFGVLMTASRFFCIRAGQRWQVFLSALVRGPSAMSAAAIAKALAEDDLLIGLQGVSLILLGIAVQSLPFWCSVLPALWQLLPEGG